MKNAHAPYTSLAGLALALQAASAPGATAPSSTPAQPAAPPPLSATEQWIKDAKNPVPWLTWGADLRVRNEYYDNIVTLGDNLPGHEQDLFRIRGRVWASALPVENLSLNGRVAAEPREWMKPAFVGAYRNQQGMEWRYGIIDNLNVKYTNAFNQPLSITAGRQDILIGDYWNWWLVADGTPLDGSWTYFLDSIRVGYEAKEIKTKFDLIYIHQNALADEWVPTFNANQRALLTEQNEQGVIAYVSNKSIKNTTLDAFFIYKGDDQEIVGTGDNADIYTLGGRATGALAEHWQYSAEGAYQFGEKQDPTVKDPGVPNLGRQWRDIDAFGANGRLTYLFNDRLKNQLQLAYEFLSGDDPATTGKDEMFDILWGRWPRWSELYIYSYINENGGRIAQLNNVQRIGPGWSISPIKNMTFSTYYNALFAPEDTPTRAPAAGTAVGDQFSRDGNFRGHLLQTVLKHQFSRHLTAHLWSEFVWQGDYYTQEDLMTFLRGEVYLTF